MRIHRLATDEAVGREAARAAGAYLRATIEHGGGPRIAVATGTSPFAFLAHLVQEPDIAWSRVTMFHLDEYVGLPADHPAAFRRYLHERLIDKVHPGEVVLINGEAAAAGECRRLASLVAAGPIDAAFVGIGENGHLAFNDPPADFATTDPYIVVELDETSRRQQVGEGWFPTLDAVPAAAISMSVHQIMAAHRIFCVVPEQRKAGAVRAALHGPVTPLIPASILQRHPATDVYLDAESASLLPP